MAQAQGGGLKRHAKLNRERHLGLLQLTDWQVKIHLHRDGCERDKRNNRAKNLVYTELSCNIAVSTDRLDNRK
ncbi:MAG TPA: hypothetical protein VF472_12840 [Burkholderiaceae bacterium]